MKIIINADDLGIHRDVNDAIFSLMGERRITSATLLANGAEVEDAARRLDRFPHCSFGAHLNLSEFRPLTTGAGLKPILRADGCFAGNRLREIRITGALREAVFAEWSAQVERLQGLGVRVSHFDSHKHMHTVPALLPLFRRLLARFGVRKARLTLNLSSPDAPRSFENRAGKAVWNFTLRNWCGAQTVDAFTSFETFSRIAKDSLQRFGSMELMVHPGGADCERETMMLRTDWAKGLPFTAEMISYDEL
jgi:chitin disaccharide deacetylase